MNKKEQFEILEILEYSCPSNYILKGSSKTRCDSDGWSGSPPFCQLIGCPEPSHSTSYTVHPSRGYFRKHLTFGDYTKVACRSGFVIRNGRETTSSAWVRCQRNGMWEDFPNCEEITCKLPNPPKNGHYIGLTENREYYRIYSRLNFVCNPGFVAENKTPRVCSHNGQWSGRHASCKEMTCPNFHVPNGRSISDNSVPHRIGDILYFECHHFYNLESPNWAQCLQDGKWNRVVQCKKMQCTDLPILTNAIYSSNSNELRPIQSRADFDCKNGLKGSLYCNEDGQWNHTSVQEYCQQETRLKCSIRPNIENAHLLPPNKEDNFVGDISEIQCALGYQLVGNGQLECLENGLWNQNFGYCARMKVDKCDPLPFLQNGKYIDNRPAVYRPSVLVEFNCYEGFFSEKTHLVCDQNGHWNYSPVNDCQPLQQPNEFCEPLPENEDVSYSEIKTYYRRNSFVHFECLKSQLKGTLHCDDNGHWNKWVLNQCQTSNKLQRPLVECPMPGNIENGKINFSNVSINRVGNVLELNCDLGFNLKGANRVKCLEDGKWNQTLGICEESLVTCGTLPDLNGTNILLVKLLEVSSERVGSRVSVECQPGHVNLGKNYLECKDDGTWDTRDVRCQYEGMPCSQPPFIQNGKILQNGKETFELHSQLTYQCNPGFLLFGVATRICLDSGWSGEEPFCQEIKCLPFGVKLKTESSELVEVGTSITVKCPTGTRLKEGAQAVLVCLENGQWNGTLAMCKPITCPLPTALEFGNIQINQTSNFQRKAKILINTRISFQCDEGFFLEGEPNQICTQNGWSHQKPICISNHPKTCSPQNVPTIINGKVEPILNKRYKTGDFLPIVCNPGHKLSKTSSSVVCDDSGNWQKDNLQECVAVKKIISCPKPSENISNVVLEELKEFYHPGDMITVSCKEGFTAIIGSEYLLCLDDGQWDDDFPFCEAATCQPPKVPRFGSYEEQAIIGGNPFPYWFEINYYCYPGYQIIGQRVSRCLSNYWLGEVPTCTKIRCKDLTSPDNGGKSGSSVEVGAKIVFSCFAGFILSRSKERTCLPNGQWSGEDTICDSGNNYCSELGTPANGIKSGSSYNYTDVVSFDCNHGFTLLGSRTRTCKMDRNWTGTEARCIGKNEFDNLNQISLELKSVLSKLKREEKRKNYSLAVYFVLDCSISFGQKNFERSKKLAIKIVDSLERSSKTFVGVSSFCSEDVDISPTSLEDKQEVINFIEDLEFQDGRMSLQNTFQILQDKLFEETKKISNKPLRSIVFLLTGGKFSVGSKNPIVTATSLFKSTNSTIFSIVSTGYPYKDILHSITDIAGRSGKIFFVDSFSRLDHLNNLDDGPIDFSNCGANFNIEESGLSDSNEQEGQQIQIGTQQQNNKTLSWPWSVKIFYVSPKKEQFLLCSGSLINKKWVLSAASCLLTENSLLNDPKSLTLKIGSNNQVQSVKRLVIHPLYQRSYSQNNALLIELEKPVLFGPSLRPICIQSSTSNVKIEHKVSSKLGYFATLSDNAARISTSYIHLPFPPRSACLLSLSPEDKFHFTELYFCAGDGKSHPHDCGVDLGGPLVLPEINSEGQLVWSQIGILIDLQHCHSEKLYSFYLNIEKINNWIEQVIRK